MIFALSIYERNALFNYMFNILYNQKKHLLYDFMYIENEVNQQIIKSVVLMKPINLKPNFIPTFAA
jgi:hypothetical protein